MAAEKGKVVIVGGGIGGLPAATALLRAGFDVAVRKQAPELREAGAGLTVWPNAMRALECLGLHEAIGAIGRSFGVGRIHDWRGRVLVEGARQRAAETLWLAGHRPAPASVVDAPCPALPPGVLRLGMRCTGFAQDDSAATVRFADGSEERAALLVGADGLNSPIRGELFGQEKPRYTGYAAYRGITRFLLEGDVACEAWGFGQRFGFVPGPGDDVYWWAAVSVPEGLNPLPTSHKADVLSLYRNWFEPVT